MKCVQGLPFELPVPSSLAQANTVRWTGRGFDADGALHGVLEFSENFEGWSDDLTSLHEAAVGDQHPMDASSREDAFEQVAAHTQAGQTVLEIGCSSGYLLRELNAKLSGVQVLGADVVQGALQRLSHASPELPLLRFDLLKSPVPNACLDTLVMLNVLEHIADDRLAMQQVFRMLRPGGHLVLEVPSGSHLLDAYDQQLHHFRRYDEAPLLALLRECGFEIVRNTHLGQVVYPAFAFTKRLNRWRYRNGAAPDLVKAQAAGSASGGLMKWAMRLDAWWRARFNTGRGVRNLVTARKPK